MTARPRQGGDLRDVSDPLDGTGHREADEDADGKSGMARGILLWACLLPPSLPLLYPKGKVSLDSRRYSPLRSVVNLHCQHDWI